MGECRGVTDSRWQWAASRGAISQTDNVHDGRLAACCRRLIYDCLRESTILGTSASSAGKNAATINAGGTPPFFHSRLSGGSTSYLTSHKVAGKALDDHEGPCPLS